MKTIKVSVADSALAEIYLRQTPHRIGVWADCNFIVNTPLQKCDWWVICHNSGLTIPETTLCDPKHIVYVSMEPSDSWLPQQFLDQFSHLVSCDRPLRHPIKTFRNGLTWWVGIQVKHEGVYQISPQFILDYDMLSAMRCPDKKKFLSIICSNKSFMTGHKKRNTFLEKLRAHPISAHIDFFGGGINPVDDKWDVIAPYKYHLVLENSVVPDYWSEKLADSFLGFAFPIYYGCPNIHDYFSRDALRIIDIENFDETVTALEELLIHDPYQKHLPAINKARQQVLNDYNLFQLIADICDKPAKRLAQCQLKPRTSFSQFKPAGASSGRSLLLRMVNNLIHRLGGTLT